MFPGVLQVLAGFYQLPRLQQKRIDRVRCILDLILVGASGIHAVLAVGGCIQHFARIGQEAVVDFHFVEHATNHAEVAQVGFEARHDVDFAVATHFLVFHAIEREVSDDAFEHVVPAGGVRANEAGGMSERHRKLVRYMTLFLGVADEGVEVVADDFRHAGGRDRDHVRLVQCLGIGHAIKHVLLATKDRCILGHGIRHTGNRLLEMPVEVGTEVSDTAL